MREGLFDYAKPAETDKTQSRTQLNTSGRQCRISPPSSLFNNHSGQLRLSTSNPALSALFQSDTIDPGPLPIAIIANTGTGAVTVTTIRRQDRHHAGTE